MTGPDPAAATARSRGGTTIAPPERDPRYGVGVLMVMAGAVCLSTSGIFVRAIEAASGWQILFWRSAWLVLTVLVYLLIRHRGRIRAPIRAIGLTGVGVALLLTMAFTGFVFALLMTTVANVVFMLGASPFVAALLGWWLLGERIRRGTAFAIVAVMAGIGLMVADGLAAGRLAGNLVALVTVFGFACQIILLRRAKAIDMLPAVGLAGLFNLLLASALVEGITVPFGDLVMTMLLGTVNVGAGIMLLTAGARQVPAAEVALYSLVEAVLAPIWVAILFGEHPSLLTLAGGGVVLSAVASQAVGALRRQRPRHVGVA